MSTNSDEIQKALKRHFAKPDDGARVRALYDVIGKSTIHEVDIALHQALLTRSEAPVDQPPAKPPLTPKAMLSNAPSASVGPIAEPIPKRNWAGNIGLGGALAAFEVADAADVEQVIAQALAGADPKRRVLRALGTTHSSSSVIATEGTIVDTGALIGSSPEASQLRRVARVEKQMCRPGVDHAALVSVGAGLRVREVIAALAEFGRALPMLGAYTGQTYVGALCTGTHGSGIQHGALHTAVRAIDIIVVDPNGNPARRRVERAPGITNPARMPPDVLVQDDDVFRAVVVGLGCLGVITSVIVETVAPYRLQADRIHREWRDIRAILGDVDASGYPNYFANTYAAGVLMNPYPWPLMPVGPRKGLITRAWKPAKPPPHPEPPTVAGGCDLLFDVARFLGNFTALTPWALNMAIDSKKATTSEYGEWWQVLASSGDLPRGYSVEYSLPLDGYLPALDAILAAMYDLAWNKRKMLAGTLSIRFVRPRFSASHNLFRSLFP